LLKIVSSSSSRKFGSVNAESGNDSAFLISGSTNKSLFEISLIMRIRPSHKRQRGHVYSDMSRILPLILKVFRGKQQATLRTDQLTKPFIDSIELLGSQAATTKTHPYVRYNTLSDSRITSANSWDPMRKTGQPIVYRHSLPPMRDRQHRRCQVLC